MTLATDLHSLAASVRTRMFTRRRTLALQLQALAERAERLDAEHALMSRTVAGFQALRTAMDDEIARLWVQNRRMEKALNEYVENEREEAEAAQARVVRLPVRLEVVQ